MAQIPLPCSSLPAPSVTSLAIMPKRFSLWKRARTAREHSQETSAKRTGWLLLKEVLKAARDGSDLCLPLKAALVGIVEIMDVVDNVRDVEDAFFKISRRIDGFQQIFSQYQAEDDIPLVIQRRLKGLSGQMVSIGDKLKKKLSRPRLKRTIKALGDIEEIATILEELATLIERFQMECILNTELQVEDIGAEGALGKLDHVPDAGIDSQRGDACMEGTRVKLLLGLKSWAHAPTASRVFWLNGMAGTGKSAIARSLCYNLRRDGLLGGSFFCSRGTRDAAKRIIPTLAVALARQNGLYKLALLDVLRETPDIAHDKLEIQIERLLKKPLCDAFGDQPPSLVLVIDAVDECSDDTATEAMLSELVSRSLDIPIKFFITSRPEPHIRAQFNTWPNLHRVLRLHDVAQDLVATDITLYLTRRLEQMRQSRQRSDYSYQFPDGWPSRTDIATVAQHAGNLFIYAFTAMEYVRVEPVGRLQRLSSLLVTAGQPMSRALDDMYAFILANVMDPGKRERHEVLVTKRVLGVILAARERLRVSRLSELIGITVQHIRSIIDPLHAVIYIPPRDADGMVSTFHASFGDYLTTRERAKDFFLDLSTSHHELARGCIKVMASDVLHFNVAKCRSSHLSNIQQTLSPLPDRLVYSCLHWSHHLIHADRVMPLLASLEDLFKKKFLFWLEVLSAVQKSHLATRLLMSALTAGNIRNRLSQSQATFLRNANDFVVSCREAIGLSIPHIYISGLPAVHPTSMIARIFWPLSTQGSVIEVLGEGRAPRKVLLRIEDHASPVRSVAFSADGTQIVSGSEDKTIRVWDSTTGESLIPPLHGHSEVVRSVAFSPDGTRIVSASEDETVRLWSAVTGDQLIHPIKGHDDWVACVAFSPDGTRIVTSSWDTTIRLWDAATGESLTHPLEGHTGPVCSVAFSPDGTQVVSGSADQTVRIWDAMTGESLIDSFEGHSDWVLCVAFSPDGTRIVSGSSDKSIQVWDASTGEPMFDPLEGHTERVCSVAYFPDGSRIFSCSDDKTIRIWDAMTGELLAPSLQGHSDWVHSIAISSDGTRIVSGSEDTTIRVWDATSGDSPLIQPLEGHLGEVWAVAYSPDGTKIASCSDDRTIRIWDAITGEPLNDPLEGHLDWVRSIEFSPDGARIVSCSDDMTVRIWDAATGEALLDPLTGHTSWVVSVAFSPDGTRVVSGSIDKTIRLWDVLNGEQLIHVLKGHTDQVWSVVFSPDGSRIVSGSSDRTVRQWDANTGEPLGHPFKGHAGTVRSVAISPDGTRIASCSEDKTIRIWDADTGRTLVHPFKGHTDRVWSVAFSFDGTQIASGSDDRTIRVWDAATGKPLIYPLEGHTDQVWSVAFSPDATRVVSGSLDKTVRVWNVMPDDEAPLHPFAIRLQDSIQKILVDAVSSSAATASSQPTHNSCPVDHATSSHSTASSDSKGEGPRNVFSFDWNSGWIKSPQGELVLWVPHEYRSGMWWPRNTLVIGRSRTIYDLTRFVHGTEWTECYGPRDKVSAAS